MTITQDELKVAFGRSTTANLTADKAIEKLWQTINTQQTEIAELRKLLMEAQLTPVHRAR